MPVENRHLVTTQLQDQQSVILVVHNKGCQNSRKQSNESVRGQDGKLKQHSKERQVYQHPNPQPLEEAAPETKVVNKPPTKVKQTKKSSHNLLLKKVKSA